jgi:hypothetical protein
MTIEVIIPQMRPQHLDKLLYSFSVNGAPDLITFVSNLDLSLRVAKPCPVRQLKYSSCRYSTGPYTVGLKRNIGAWWAQHDQIVFFDDDQLASKDMISSFDKLFNTQDVVYGHHRFIDYQAVPLEDILTADPHDHLPREVHIGKHWWESGYGGLMGIHQDLYIKLGGNDLWWSNVASHEDQDFTRRLMLEKGWDGVEVQEPPFAWHPLWTPEGKLPCTPEPSPLCNIHTIVTKTLHDVNYQACSLCTWHAAPRIPMNNRLPFMPFNPVQVDVTEKWL